MNRWQLLGLSLLANSLLASAGTSLEAASACHAANPEQARVLAEKAFTDGAYQLAGNCYLVAGDKPLADRAFLKAVPPASEATAQQLAANRDEAKAQVRKWQSAWRHR